LRRPRRQCRTSRSSRHERGLRRRAKSLRGVPRRFSLDGQEASMTLRTKLALLVSGLGMTMVLAMLLLVNQIMVSHFQRIASEDVTGARKLLAQSFAQS